MEVSPANMCIIPMFGVIRLTKNHGSTDMAWVHFFVIIGCGKLALIVVASLGVMSYFKKWAK